MKKIPLKDKLYVALQTLVAVSWFFEVERTVFIIPENLRWLALFGAGTGGILVFVAFLQLRSNLSPFPSPRQEGTLITTGVFAFARHPIYSGILFMAFGFSFWLNSGYKLIISVLLLMVFYAKTGYEEERLAEKFPNYSSYRKETGRFFPKFRWRF